MSKSGAIETAPPEALPEVEREVEQDQQPQRQPRFHVILWNDDDHSYGYVIVMLMKLFRHSPERSYELAREVDRRGKAVVLTTTKEHAELKRDQIHAFGPDGGIASCQGAMWATIEPDA